MKVRVQIARSQREYANVIVDAPSVEAAEAYVTKLLASDDYNEAYCDLVNNVSWDSGTGEAFDEEVLDAEQHDDDDEEADVVVPS
jgi:hypothetical protein